MRDAVAAYRNADGGFGHGLEPDGRTPGTQPAATEQALRILDQADAWDEELARGACDQLQAAAPAEGGAVFVDDNVEGWPHAPWWQPAEGFSLISTGQILGSLLGPRHAPRVGGPGVRADVGAHRVARGARPIRPLRRAALPRSRARPRARAPTRSSAWSGPIREVVTLDPEATGEVHGPLGFAPHPDSIARPLFDAATIAAHLDHLAAGQQPDGGWTFNFPAWSPAQEADWRGSVTVDALDTLRRNERPL